MAGVEPHPATYWPPARLVQWSATAVIVAVAEIVYFAGHTLVSFALDSLAVAVFFGVRRLRDRGLRP